MIVIDFLMHNQGLIRHIRYASIYRVIGIRIFELRFMGYILIRLLRQDLLLD